MSEVPPRRRVSQETLKLHNALELAEGRVNMLARTNDDLRNALADVAALVGEVKGWAVAVAKRERATKKEERALKKQIRRWKKEGKI